MNQQQAVRKLSKLLGPKFAYRYNPDALVGDDRAQANENRKAMARQKALASEALEKRRDELLSQDPEYKRLIAEWKIVRDAHDKLSRAAFFHRVEVGTHNSLAFHVLAQADNWDDAVAMIEKRQADHG